MQEGKNMGIMITLKKPTAESEVLLPVTLCVRPPWCHRLSGFSSWRSTRVIGMVALLKATVHPCLWQRRVSPHTHAWGADHPRRTRVRERRAAHPRSRTGPLCEVATMPWRAPPSL